MKRLIHLGLLCFILFSCNENGLINEQKVDSINKRKVDVYLDYILKDKYSNYSKNELVRDKATKELNKKFDSLIKVNVLNDIPLKVWKISKNPHGKGALVHLYADNYSSESKMLSDRLGYDVIGFMDVQKATKLLDSKKYYVTGNKFNRLNETEAFLIVNQLYYSPKVEINRDAIYNDIFKFKMGVFMCEIDSIKPTK